MASETDVANMALSRIRVGQRIGDINEATHTARTCKFWLPHCRKSVLRDFPWSFAYSSVALSQVADEPFPGYRYVYAYPQHCITVRAVADDGGIRHLNAELSAQQESLFPISPTGRAPFRLAIRADGESRVILSDVPDAYAFFTFDVATLTVWPPDAISALAWNLAGEIASPVQAEPAEGANARQVYALMLSHAGANDLNEARDDRYPDSPSVLARL